MWHHVSMSSLGVIDEAELELGEGLSVITGETGAGKTMVITALSLLRGERADPGLVRSGASQARVEASIGVPDDSAVRGLVEEAGGRIDDSLVVGRVVSAQGRSRAIAGGATVPAGLLADLTNPLVAVHGQSDQHRLLRSSEQRRALDRFAGSAFATVKAEYSPAFDRLRVVERTLDELRTHAQERARELDLLQYGLDEIRAVEPLEGEDEALLAEESRLAHAEGLLRAAATAQESLSGDGEATDAQTVLASAAAELDSAAGHDASLDALASRLREVSIVVDDIATELGSYAADVDLDPRRLATVQSRRADLGTLQRKYGPTLADVLGWAEKSAARLAEISGDDSTISTLEDEQRALEPRVRGLAEHMSTMRTEAALRLAEAVGVEITQLSMPSARLEVQVRVADDARLTEHGIDSIEFEFAANSGTPLRPIHKGASGGELSRLMLGLEVVLADSTTVPTLVFDEVDAGIGGKAAVEVGRRLAKLAETAQVIAVTHLPQVAAFAHHHFVVTKDDDGFVTKSSVVELGDDARVDELARMLAGQDESDAAREHARELLDLARS